jgi:hypothetical protein
LYAARGPFDTGPGIGSTGGVHPRPAGKPGKTESVLITNEKTDRYVIIDAVQLVPVEE